MDVRPAHYRTARRRWSALAPALACAALFVPSAGCPRVVQQYTAMPSRVLPAQATLAQVIEVINSNTAQTQSLYSTHATLSGPKLPSLSAVLAVERPQRFRLRAKTAFSGSEVDLGSNEELFWFWVRRNDPPAVYYCRHDQFQQSAAPQVIPVEPQWIVEALGLVLLDPAGDHRGPYPLPGGRLEIRTHQPGTDIVRRSTVVDEERGWIVEQHVFDAEGQRIATALASDHRRDPVSNVTLPGRVEVQWPSADFRMQIELRELQINQLPPEAAALWQKPEIPDAEDIDLAGPAFRPAVPGGVAPQTPGGSGVLPASGIGAPALHAAVPPRWLPALAPQRR